MTFRHYFVGKIAKPYKQKREQMLPFTINYKLKNLSALSAERQATGRLQVI